MVKEVSVSNDAFRGHEDVVKSEIVEKEGSF
jgi:hypothetical protein